ERRAIARNIGDDAVRGERAHVDDLAVLALDHRGQRRLTAEEDAGQMAADLPLPLSIVGVEMAGLGAGPGDVAKDIELAAILERFFDQRLPLLAGGDIEGGGLSLAA